MRDYFDSTIRTIDSLTVHAGTFHSDDVFCGAVSMIINPDVTIHRVSKADQNTDIQNGIVVADIGFGPFDHHQKDCPLRDDGIKHCGASRLWLVYGLTAIGKICPDASEAEKGYVCRHIYDGMLRTIAALDNGTEDFPKGVYSIATIVEGFRPGWDSELTYDQGYFNAVNCMKQILVNEINEYAAEYRAFAYVTDAISASKNGTVILEKYCPWKEPVIADKCILTIVYPSLRGGWNLEPVPNEKEEITYRVHVPDEWRGKTGKDADAAYAGMTFCHAKGFLASFATKEKAIEAAEYLNNNCSNQ